MSRISVFCPINSAIVYVGSDRIDDLGQFTKFILWAISEKYSIREISDTVSLGDMVVEDEVSYLLRIGFLNESETELEISETGQGYLDLIASVEQFNNSPRKTHLNCFTGNVGRPNPAATCSIPDNALRLPEKVSKFIVQNRDYQPLQEYARSEFMDCFSHLRPEFFSSLYFYLYLEDMGEYMFQEYTLPSLPPVSEQFSSSDGTMIILSRGIVCLHFYYEDSRLLRYRTVIDTLEKLSIFDSTLLSQTADELLSFVRDERMVNASTTLLFIDASTGNILLEQPEQEDLGQRSMVSVPIPDQPYKYDEFVEISVPSGTTQYRRILKRTDRTRLNQKVPFSIFEEVRLHYEP